MKLGSEIGPYGLLLGSLIAFMGMVPFVVEDGLSALILRFGLTGVFLAGVFVASRGRALRTVLLPLFLIVLGTEWLTYLFEIPSGMHARLFLDAILLSYLAILQLSNLLREESISVDTVLGGINIYFLIALAYMMMHTFVEAVHPGSYLALGVPLGEQLFQGDSSEAFATMLYFSFVTITTLGYGDIAPAVGAAKMLSSSEAVFGQIYLATFIARLVALQVAARQEGSK